MFRSFLPVFKLALLAAATFPAPAVAQGNPSDQTQKDEGEGDVGTIIVYGNGIEGTAAATGLTLTPRETPQSITIITREQMDDQAATTVADVLEYTMGISVKRVDRGRNLLSARGFDITSFQIDGLPFASGNIGGGKQRDNL